MIAQHCSREAEFLDALASGRWPEASDLDLREHVAGCADCAALALVASSIETDRREVETLASPPPAGAVWWRMQMRMEREAHEAAAKTARRAHSAIVVATLGALGALLVVTKLLGAAWSWLAAAMPRSVDLPALQFPLPSTTMLLIAAASLLVFTPVIVWLAVAEE